MITSRSNRRSLRYFFQDASLICNHAEKKKHAKKLNKISQKRISCQISVESGKSFWLEQNIFSSTD